MKKGLRGGFTLIEILVVLVIMGFLVAMVAPKLSGIVDSAVDTACDTNQERLRSVLNSHVAQTKSMPDGLINMIKYQTDTTTSANVAIPDGDDNDKANGREFLSSELIERMHPQVHFINDAEATELIGLGIKNVFNLASVVALATTAGAAEEANIVEQNVRQTVAAGLPVFMIGVGANSTGTVNWATGNDVVVTGSALAEGTTPTSIYDASGTTLGASAESDGTFVRFDEAQHIGRIVMGISNKGELVQGGMLEESGTCPGQIQRADHHTWGNYLVVLPRLAATMERLDVDTDGEIALHAVAIDTETGTSATGAKIVGRTGPSGYQYFNEEDASMFTTSCPEGHTWGAVADAYAVAIQD